MGGLRTKMPRTYWTFLSARLALAGFPLLSGFFTKDEILWEGLLRVTGAVGGGLTTAVLTAFYSFRRSSCLWRAARDEKLFESR